MKSLVALVVLSLFTGPLARSSAPSQGGGLAKAMTEATRFLDAGELPRAREALDRVLERDPNSLPGWELVERWAEKAADRDERVHALHRQLALARTQKKDKAAIEAIRARLLPLDPVADQLAKLRTSFVEKLAKMGEGYEKNKRPHSAIRALKQALALDPDRADIRASIERIAAAPDPSLADDARPRDLLEGVSAEWIVKHDAEHIDWSDRAALERPNYRTQTNAGYEVLVRTAEAMEQMNAFYRVFFRYGAEGDKRNPSRIDVNIFKAREEYTQDPEDWSGGHFTGDAVETYITAGGFEDMTNTLFHEAAHQFVSLATSATGWLNEGLASFFEGTRILANGTVVMNLPANHRLFPLVERMDRGFMADVDDGIDPSDVTKDPPKAPTFRIVLEGEYEWGPPWYAPTWGLVFFLYNFQDPADGRFVYRKSFWDWVDATGGKQGDSAVSTFEELVLANPEPVTEGIQSTLALPKTADEVNAVWRDYLFQLRDRQTGSDQSVPPYLEWAAHARKRGALDDAAEFLERALQTATRDVAVLEAFADFLAARKGEDRASKLLTQALALVENTQPVDQARITALEERLRRVDVSYQRLDEVRTALIADVTALIERYLAEKLNLQAMDVAVHLGSELQEPSLFALYEKAVRDEGRALSSWRLAYNEEDLRGWNVKGLESIFQAQGEVLISKFGEYKKDDHVFQMLTLDEITSGDFSLEAEVEAVHQKVAFAGLVFGRKSANDCHALILDPPSAQRNGNVDLVTFYGSGAFKPWRHNPVQLQKPEGAAADRTAARDERSTFKLRIDVIGRLVDVWVNGEYVVTHEFPSLEVLRGTFGLITGCGEARFRNVRFLARHPRDPSGALERKLKLEEKLAGGDSVNGSWINREPPFPIAQRWLQEERKSWAEAKGSPQLLVLWSTEQNDEIAIDGYLRALAEKHADVGLRIVNVLAFWNESGAESYLQAHPFPGSVCLDTPTEAEKNFGKTLERYDVMRFHLPRFLLLDIDGKVVWEGDPGFAKGQSWNGEEALLDVPLRELVVKRRLTEFAAWREKWPAARAALARGDFAAAAPALKQANDFDPTVSDEVADALALLGALESAASGADALAARLAELGREPALEVLLAWAEVAGKPVKKSKALTAILKGPNVPAWKRAPGMVKPVAAKVGKDAKVVEETLQKVAALPGAFPAELADALRASASDASAFKAALEDAAGLPARWLASEHFRW